MPIATVLNTARQKDVFGKHFIFLLYKESKVKKQIATVPNDTQPANTCEKGTTDLDPTATDKHSQMLVKRNSKNRMQTPLSSRLHLYQKLKAQNAFYFSISHNYIVPNLKALVKTKTPQTGRFLSVRWAVYLRWRGGG